MQGAQQIWINDIMCGSSDIRIVFAPSNRVYHQPHIATCLVTVEN